MIDIKKPQYSFFLSCFYHKPISLFCVELLELKEIRQTMWGKIRWHEAQILP